MRKNEGLMKMVVVAIVFFALTFVALSVGAASTPEETCVIASSDSDGIAHSTNFNIPAGWVGTDVWRHVDTSFMPIEPGAGHTDQVGCQLTGPVNWKGGVTWSGETYGPTAPKTLPAGDYTFNMEWHGKLDTCRLYYTLKRGATSNLTQQRLYPVADGEVYAYSYRNWDWANKGMTETMRAGWNPTGGESRAYLKFDVPADLGVNRAVLKLCQYYRYGPVHTLGVYRVTGPWDEGTDTYHSGEVEETAALGELCWMQQPSFDPVSVATFTSATDVPAWVEVDITSLVQLWQAGTPNYGLVVKTESNFEATSGFFTKERPTEPEVKASVKQSVCASAKPSYTEGGEFEPGNFTIGGTQPQKVAITSQADNFVLRRGDGVIVYQRSDGKSSGSLTLVPGSYNLSCGGGGVMGLESATVCIEYPVVEVTPTEPEVEFGDPERVCASANPSYTEGGEFEPGNFTIGGTQPQKVAITSQADNFVLRRGDGVIVYQRSDGKSSGSLTLVPGNYNLSCGGGGAMGTMSAIVCIEYPVVTGTPPTPTPTPTLAPTSAPLEGQPSTPPQASTGQTAIGEDVSTLPAPSGMTLITEEKVTKIGGAPATFKMISGSQLWVLYNGAWTKESCCLIL